MLPLFSWHLLPLKFDHPFSSPVRKYLTESFFSLHCSAYTVVDLLKAAHQSLIRLLSINFVHSYLYRQWFEEKYRQSIISTQNFKASKSLKIFLKNVYYLYGCYNWQMNNFKSCIMYFLDLKKILLEYLLCN